MSRIKFSRISHRRTAALLVLSIVCNMTWASAGAVVQSGEKIGIASFYARKFEGRSTASGELFANEKFTGAHRTLPFGTLVRVVNLDNGKEVVVRINDRGPFIKGRIIDVSQRAAKELDFYLAGTAKVRIEVIEKEPMVNFITPITSIIVDSSKVKQRPYLFPPK